MEYIDLNDADEFTKALGIWTKTLEIFYGHSGAAGKLHAVLRSIAYEQRKDQRHAKLVNLLKDNANSLVDTSVEDLVRAYNAWKQLEGER